MIVPMSKVQVLGPRRLLPDVLAFLQAQGMMQLRALPVPQRRSVGEPLYRAVHADPAAEAQERALAAALERIDRFVESLPSLEERSTADRPTLPDAAEPAFSPAIDALDAELGALRSQRSTLADEERLVTRYGRLLVAISALKPALSLEAKPHTFGLVMKRAQGDVLPLLEREVYRLTEGLFDLQTRPVDEEGMGILLSVPERNAREVAALLFERGVEEITLPPPYAQKSRVEALAMLLERGRAIPAEAARVETRLRERAASYGAVVRTVRRDAADRLARLRATSQCAETELAFIVAGWMPAERVQALTSATKARYAGAVTVQEYALDAADRDDVPVVLRNPPWLRPFELLLSLVPLPRYGSMDPTPFLALFFPLFLGFILGDVVFGALVLALALVGRRRHWGGDLGRDVSAIAVACGAWAVVFGVLFGEALGGLGAHWGLRPLVLDRTNRFVELLALTLVLGAVHVLLGMVLGVIDSARHRHWREELARADKVALIVSAGIGLGGAAGYLPPSIGRWALIAMGLFFVVGIVAGGFMVPLELVLAIGNILSYARLMALGLASVLLADVANRIAVAVHPAALGLGIAVVLHAANLAMALVSPTVSALRLHYVEFFEKFYDEGGRPFHPFAFGS